jgi:hypothetical protein
MKGFKLLSRHIFLVLIIFLALIWVLIRYSGSILSKNHPVDAKILVIEGWLPPYILESVPSIIKAKKYETIVLTGLLNRKSNHYTPSLAKFDKQGLLWIGEGGMLLKDEACKSIKTVLPINSVTIYAFGTKALSYTAHFSLFLNDTLIGQAFTINNSSDSFVFALKKPFHELRSLFFLLDNDVKYYDEDRNIRLDSIRIGNQIFSGPKYFQYVSNMNIDERNLGFQSNSQKTAVYLLDLGVKQKLIFLDTLYYGRNRTLIAAECFKKWCLKNNIRANYSINVLSMDMHSRRTYIAYKRELKSIVQTGVISLPAALEKPEWMHGYPSLSFLWDEYVSLLLTII